MSKLKSVRPFHRFSEFIEEHPLAAELPYWEFSEDTVVLADGSLVKGAKLSGLAIETWDESRISQLTLQLRSALNSLPDGAEVQILVESSQDVSERIDEHERLSQSAASPVIAEIARERVRILRDEMEGGGFRRTEIRLFLYERVAQKTKSVFSFFSAPKSFQSVRREEHARRASDLEKKLLQLSEQLATAGVGVSRLSAEEVRRYVYQFMNPTRSKDSPLPRLPSGTQDFTPDELKIAPELAVESPRSTLCYSDMILSAEGFFLDGLYHRIITLKSLPENTFASMAARLMALPGGTTLSFSIQVPEQSKELSLLQMKRRMAHSMSVSQAGRVSDLESEAKLESTEELLREIIQSGQKILYTQLAILVRDESQNGLDQKVKSVLGRIRELSGAEGLTETVASHKVLKSILPAGATVLVRPKRMKTDNVVDFLPIYEPYAGSPRPVCLLRDRYDGLVSYDPFDSSVANANTLVTGGSGSGKSFLHTCLGLQFESQRPATFVIDVGGSYKRQCELMGGTYLEIVPPTDAKKAFPSVNPMLLPPGEKEPSPQKIKFLLILLEVMLTDGEHDRLKRLSKSSLEEAIVRTYHQADGREITLSNLVETLKASPEADLRDFAKMLYPWTGDRAYGRLLDRPGALDMKSNFVVFDLKGLSAYEDLQSVVIMMIADYILGRIDAMKTGYKRILMDECWVALKTRVGSQFMEYCVRTNRKEGAGITFVTQGLTEICASPIGSAILDCTANKIILPQKGDLDPIRDVLKLNPQEVSLIQSLRQKKGSYSEAFLMAGDSRAVVRIRPTPLDYWIATTDPADKALLEQAHQRWPSKHLFEIVQELARRYPLGAQGATKLEVA
jgi:conjugal transfer ATP-binding protein TraC